MQEPTEVRLEYRVHGPAAKVTLSAHVLDRIDEIARPRRSANPLDAGWTSSWVADRCGQRRSALGR